MSLLRSTAFNLILIIILVNIFTKINSKFLYYIYWLYGSGLHSNYQKSQRGSWLYPGLCSRVSWYIADNVCQIWKGRQWTAGKALDPTVRTVWCICWLYSGYKPPKYQIIIHQSNIFGVALFILYYTHIDSNLCLWYCEYGATIHGRRLAFLSL